MITYRGIRIVVVLASTLICGSAAERTLLAQVQPHRTRIAVLRFKSSQETPERKYIVKDLSLNLAASMRESGRFDMPDDAAVQKAMRDEGLKPDGLLSQEKCFDVGKALNVDYVVAGSAMLQRVKWHACVRVLSVQNKSLAATADVEYSVDEMNSLYGVLTSQISEALRIAPKTDSTMKNFTWRGDYLLSFGKHRIDLEPPILLAMNADPPFELSIIADMAVASGNHAVTNFEVFVDDMGIGSVHGELTPPVRIREREWVIGGLPYQFSLELRDMRVFTVHTNDGDVKFVTSAAFSVTARQKEKD